MNPDHPVTTPAPETFSGSTEGESRSRGRILVVDDDASVREMLTRILAGEGYLVWAASNGTAAVTIAVAAQVDLVLLDLNMPGRNGWDTFEQLTAENHLLSVIIVTARPNQLFTAIGAGAGALLEKPLDFPELLRTINRLLAEPVEVRLARAAGRATGLHFVPPRKGNNRPA